MIIEVSNSGTRVNDVGNLRALSVRTTAGVALADRLGALVVSVDDEHVWLHITALRELALDAVTPGERAEWHDGFEAMISFARSKGWTSDDQHSVRAHVEYD